MRELIRQFGFMRLLALVLTFLPLAAVPLAGVVWLWQTGYLAHWLLLLAGCAALAFLMHKFLALGDRRRAPENVTGPNEQWSSRAEGAWLQVEALAGSIDPADYSLADGTALWQLARQTLERVAGHFHPEREEPLLELTLPHTLLIVERASRELRHQITHSVPFSHRLTLGTLVRARRWQELANRYHNVYRVGRALVNPAAAMYKEFSRAVGGQIMDYGSERLQRWLLQEYVRKVGFYAIELYSGNLLLSGGWPGSAQQEPLRILVLGRAGAGKSSLVQALAVGEAEPVPEESGKQLEAWRLSSPEWGELLLWDTPAWETMARRRARRAVFRADLIIWTCRADQTDLDYDSGQLRRLQRWLTERAGQPEAPLLVAVNHSDGAGEPEAVLEEQMVRRLGVAPEQLLLVNLAHPQDGPAANRLRLAIGALHPQASRGQYWRHLRRQRRRENSEIAGQQLRNLASGVWNAVKGAFSRKG